MAEDTEAALCVTGPGLEDRFAGRARLGADQLARAHPRADAGHRRPSGRRAHPAVRPVHLRHDGPPKGVVHTHGDPKAYHDLIGRRLLRITQDDVTLSVSKLYFAYGFGNAFVFPLFSGSSAVLVDRRPAPAAVDELVARHRVTLLYSVPSAYAALVADRGRGHEACFASVRAAVSAGEGMPAGLGEAGHRAARRAGAGADRLHRGGARVLRQQLRPQPSRHRRPSRARLRGGAAGP